MLDRALPQDEAKLRALIVELRRHGSVLFVVDQPATIGALPLAVARDEGVRVGYLPGLAMRRIAQIHAGEAKTDARDAAVIAHAARTLPHALRPLRQGDEATRRRRRWRCWPASTRTSPRRSISCPTASGAFSCRSTPRWSEPWERALGPRLQHPAALDLLQRYPSPQALRSAGRGRLAARLRPRAPRLGDRLAEDIVRALGEQTVVVTGTDAAALVLPQLAEQLALVLGQRQRVAEQLEELVDEHAVCSKLLTMPGVGFRTAARIVVETSGRHFATAGHLAAFAGLAPVTHRSGTSIRGERSARRGNRRLKRALYLSAFAALKDPTSRAYYDRKRTERKTHQAALLALARRRSDVLFAMLRDGSEYDTEHALAA